MGANSKKPKILLVAAGVQQKLKERLESAGLAVLQARTWRNAVDLFVEEKADAVVLEMEWDGAEVGGVEMIRIFKKSRNHPSPILIYADFSEKVEQALDAGASMFVPKSAPAEELLSALLNLLGEKAPPVQAGDQAAGTSFKQ